MGHKRLPNWIWQRSISPIFAFQSRLCVLKKYTIHLESSDPDAWFVPAPSFRTYSQSSLAEIRSIKEIQKGEELLVEYADTPQMTHHQRQDHLRKSYNFDCKCAVCTRPEKELARLDERLAALAQMVKQVDRYVATAENGLEFTQLINKILRLTEEEGIPSGLANLLHHVSFNIMMPLPAEHSLPGLQPQKRQYTLSTELRTAF
jgi:hypothetical protein